MLDGKKYLRLLVGYRPVSQKCPHCNSSTLSASGHASFCNFCEQYAGEGAAAAQTPFAAVRSSIDANDLDSALKGADQMMKGNKDPEQLYLLGVFYLNLSVIRFQGKDYNLMGFMEPNADSIRASLDLTMRWKECFFKVIKIVGDELAANLQVDPSLVFARFMSEIRLGRIVDASVTLGTLRNLDKQGTLSAYALLVYSVEKDTKQAEASLAKSLAASEINSYYYLAKYLAKHGKLSEAEPLLSKLNQMANVSMSRELLYRIRLTEEASKV
ncbi:MAG: hypothetical protein KGI04_00340 [Candidatus Micrarchaeota archaeon]|nr:hypothetical protein [Candidatus Micrarchaeota archaeon]